MSTERIDTLRSEVSAAIAGAGDTGALEALRVRYLGRKSELTSILRGIAELPPDERGQVGSAANQARQALEAELEAREAELEAVELERALISRRDRRHDARRAAGAGRRPEPARSAPSARSRTSSSASATG